MTGITYLEAHEAPPENRDSILVERAASGQYFVVTAAGAGKARMVLKQGPIESLSDASKMAERHASARGIEDIYVKGIPNAERT